MAAAAFAPLIDAAAIFSAVAACDPLPDELPAGAPLETSVAFRSMVAKGRLAFELSVALRSGPLPDPSFLSVMILTPLNSATRSDLSERGSQIVRREKTGKATLD